MLVVLLSLISDWRSVMFQLSGFFCRTLGELGLTTLLSWHRFEYMRQRFFVMV